MRLFKHTMQERVDRRAALEGTPMLNPGAAFERLADGTMRVTMTVRRGTGFLERLRPPETRRSYDLDEFGSFVIRLVDGTRTVLDVVDAFEKRFPMSRREVELAVVAFFKLLMQRNVLSVIVSRTSVGGVTAAGAALLVLLLCSALRCGAAEPAAPAAPAAAGVDRAAVAATMEEIRALSDVTGTRLPGSPGNLRLEQVVERRFKDSGFATGEIRFAAPVFEPGTLSLNCGNDGWFKLDAMHPTLMRPGNFSLDNFDARLVYLGKGGLDDLERVKGTDLKGAIAVMDYDCGDKWLDILQFDVEGFVFIGGGSYPYDQNAAKVYNSEVAVPRFFIDGEAGGRLQKLLSYYGMYQAKAYTVPSRWRTGELRDLWVLVPGADAKLAEKVVVLTAPLDANSVVPARAYGAQRALNLNLLLKLLNDFRKKRPLYSVMLVAVNAHTQRYAGERQLAWHLLAPGNDVEAMRDEIAMELRLARLHAAEYGRLRLDAVREDDRKDLPVMMEVLRQLDCVQGTLRGEEYRAAMERRARALKEARANGGNVAALKVQPLPELNEALDLSAFGAQDVRAAVERAEKDVLRAYDASGSGNSAESAQMDREKQEAMAFLAALRSMPPDEFMAKAARIKTVFDDEKLFEKWRADLDKSTGRRVCVKTALQDDFKGRVNRTMQDMLVVASTNMTALPAVERARRLAVLTDQRNQLRKVLVLFNKLDIGTGRKRTYYRQIAVNDVQRAMLKETVDKFRRQYGRWAKIYEVALDRDTKANAIRDALGKRQVALVIALEMDGHAEQVGLSYQSPMVAPGWFSGFAALCTNAAATAASEDRKNPYVDALTGTGGNKPGYYFKMPYSGIYYFHSARNTPAFALKSAFADEGRLFGPDDSVGRLDPTRMYTLQHWARSFIGALLADKKLAFASMLKNPPRARDVLWSTMLRTYNIEQFSGKPIPTLPVPGCLVAIYESSWQPNVLAPLAAGDVANCYMGITEEPAFTCFYGMAERQRMAPTAYQMDQDFRTVLYTIDKGRIQSSQQLNSNISPAPRATVPMFECREFVLKDRMDPTAIAAWPIAMYNLWPKVAKGQSDPEKYGMHGACSLSPARSHAAVGPIGIYLYRRRAEMAQDALMVITATKRCLLNATADCPQGKGFLSQEELGGNLLGQASMDMAVLNKSRNAKMKGVANQLVDEFLAHGDRLNAEAGSLKSARDHASYLHVVGEALGCEVKAYRELQRMNADMLKAVIVYMALMIPFCYFLQKLVFNFTRLEHELGGFAVLFTGIFALFRLIHPAFRIAMCPEAVFIAFVLGAIGLFTTWVLRMRFHEEMRVLFRGMGGMGEEAGYGTVSTTAMLIGVQNMRRRRVRTTLTTATIVLVVFTMLAFSSVSRKAQPTLIPKACFAPYTGLFYHWPLGGAIDEGTCRALLTMFADRAEVQVRRMLRRDIPWRLDLVSNPGKQLEIKAVIGLPAGDRVVRDSMAIVEGAPFSSLHAAEIMLSVAAADALGVGAADIGTARLRLLGREWTLRGLVDDQRYRLARDMNPNLPLVPFVVKSGPQEGRPESLDVDVANITDQLIDTAALAIMPEGTAAGLGAAPWTISVIITNGAASDRLGQEVRRMLDVTDAKFYVGSATPFKLSKDSGVPVKAGTYYVGNSYRTVVGGLAKLVIPLIIAGFIILNTMLGTVYERKSEIAVFNAIGLNPTHIFMFFLAEAAVYSFIGAVGGYLIGQILTVLLKGMGIISNININFSSLMVVNAVLFTMTLVILSTLYPGYVATRTAVPSGKRKWAMPLHDGQCMNVIFPFIYRSRLAYGVMYYLQQFFEPLSGDSLGDIVARLDGVESGQDAAGRAVLTLRYNMALSPYDLGVTQAVVFTTRYDVIVDSYRLHMEVSRISGRDTNWVTTNRPFLERMRKFLIHWRNIDPTRQDWFVGKAVEMFRNAAAEVKETNGVY